MGIPKAWSAIAKVLIGDSQIALHSISVMGNVGVNPA